MTHKSDNITTSFKFHKSYYSNDSTLSFLFIKQKENAFYFMQYLSKFIEKEQEINWIKKNEIVFD